MGKTLNAQTRARHCRTFLRVLSTGTSLREACKASSVSWSTLYKWRHKDAAFRAAWDEAVTIRDEARVADLDDEMMRRAVECIEDPIMFNGEQVASRKRYSDALLMFAVRELRGRRKEEQREAARREVERAAPKPLAPATPSADSKITVVVRQFALPAPSAAAPSAPAKTEGGDE